MKDKPPPNRLRPRLMLLAGFATASLAPAQTVVQTVNFNFTDDYALSTGNYTTVAADFFSGTFNPFNASLGQLDSFEVAWDLTTSAIGSFAEEGESFLEIGYIGDLTFAGVVYKQEAGSASSTFGEAAELLDSDSYFEDTALFDPAEAGVSFSQSIYDAVIGGDSFEILYSPFDDSVVTFYADNFVEFTGTFTGSVTLTYNYTPVPEPSAFAAILGGMVLVGTMTRRRRRVG